MAAVAKRFAALLMLVGIFILGCGAIPAWSPNDRSLASSYFSEINDVLSVTDIGIDEPQTFTIGILKLTVSGILCGGISLGDLRIDTGGDRTRKFVLLDAAGLTLRCTANWHLNTGITNDYGRVLFSSADSDVFLKVFFESKDFDVYAPHKSELAPAPDGCKSVVGIDDLKFEGDVSFLLNGFSFLVKTFMDGLLGDTLCGMAPELVDTTLSGALANFSDILNVTATRSNSPAAVRERVAQDEAALVLEHGKGAIFDLNGNPALSFIRDTFLSSLGLPSQAQIKQNISDISINSIIRGFMGNESDSDSGSGGLVLPLNMTGVAQMAQPITTSSSSSLVNLSVDVISASITGLDTFTVFEPLQAAGNFTTLVDLALKRLSFQIDLGMHLAVSPQDPATTSSKNAASLSEQFAITFGASNITLSTGLLSAIDNTALSDMQLGNLFSVMCGMSTVIRLALTHFTLDISDLDTPAIIGLFNDHVDGTFGKLLDFAFAAYQAPVLKALPHASDAFVRDLFADAVASLVKRATTNPSETCPDVAQPSYPPEYVDFQTNSIFTTLKGLVDSLFVKEAFDGRPTVNVEYIDYYTKLQSGTEGELWFLKKDFALQTKVDGLFEDVGFRAGNLKIQNLEIDALRLLDPVQKDVLLNSVTMGAKEPMFASVDLYIKLKTSRGDVILNDFTVSVRLDTVNLLLELLVAIDSEKVSFMRTGHLFTPGCLATLVDDVKIQKLAFTIGEVVASINCRTCTSAGIVELANNLQKDNSNASTTKQTNRDLKRIMNYLAGDRFGEYLNATLRDARDACFAKHGVEPTWTMPPTMAPTTAAEYAEELAEKVSQKVMKSLAGLSGVLAFIVLAAMCFAWRRERRMRQTSEYKEWKRTLDQCKKELCESTTSVFRSDVVPATARYLIPLCLCLNIGLFVSAHLSLGASVDIIISFAGEKVKILGYVEFSIAKSVIDAFNAKAYLLGFIILLFSGVWPYVKMFAMLFSWFASPQRLNPMTRGKLLRWMDVLGKWSMIDIFVLVMTLVAFRINILSPDNVVVLPRDFYVVDLIVVPVWGLYANLLAQVLSQIVSHFAMHYHRNIIANAGYHYLNNAKTKSPSPKLGKWKGDIEMVATRTSSASRGTNRGRSTPAHSWLSHGTERRRSTPAQSWLSHGTDNVVPGKRSGKNHKEALCAHVFDRTKQARVQMRVWLRMFIISLLFAEVFLLFYGCVTKSFSISVDGIAGIIMDFGRTGSSTQAYSVFDVAAAVIRQAEDNLTSRLGLNCLAVLFITCALVVPAMQVLGITTLFALPLTLRQQKRMLIVNEILAAWQYLEVYIIALLVGLMQVGPISEHLIGELCDDLFPALEELFKLGLIEEKDMTCLYISGEIENAMFVLCGAAFLLSCLSTGVTRAAERAIEEREMRVLQIPKSKQRPNQRNFKAAMFLTLFDFGFLKLRGRTDDNGPRLQPHMSAEETIVAHKLFNAGFEEMIDEETGEKYYFDLATGETTDKRPTTSAMLARPPRVSRLRTISDQDFEHANPMHSVVSSSDDESVSASELGEHSMV